MPLSRGRSSSSSDLDDDHPVRVANNAKRVTRQDSASDSHNSGRSEDDRERKFQSSDLYSETDDTTSLRDSDGSDSEMEAAKYQDEEGMDSDSSVDDEESGEEVGCVTRASPISSLQDLTVEQQLERERRKLKEAKATISSLIANVGEYKKVLDLEKQSLQAEREKLINEFQEERSKLQALVQTFKHQVG